MEYDVTFRWHGDVVAEQNRMIEWMEARGENTVCAFTTTGEGEATVSSIARVYELERDLGVTIVAVGLVEEE